MVRLYPVLKVLLEPSIRLGHFNAEPSQFRTGANEVVWEFSDIKCAARVLATGHIRRCDLLKREECNHGSVARTACPENEKSISGESWLSHGILKPTLNSLSFWQASFTQIEL